MNSCVCACAKKTALIYGTPAIGYVLFPEDSKANFLRGHLLVLKGLNDVNNCFVIILSVKINRKEN